MIDKCHFYSMLLQDKFHDFMPALDTWSGYIVPLTLITIGLIGIYESCFKSEDGHEEPSLAVAGKLYIYLPCCKRGVNQASSLTSFKLGGGKAAANAKAGFATYATGIVHGLQPDALFVVIPALALPTKAAAISFISMFVIGTVFSMAAYTLLIGKEKMPMKWGEDIFLGFSTDLSCRQ